MSIGFNWDPMGKVSKIIDDWNPGLLKTEKEYEISLVARLEKELSKEKIEQQYGAGKQKIDILINEKLAIEMKRNLKSTPEYQRLIGQITEYIEKWDYLIILIVGEVKDSLLKDLIKFVKNKDTYSMMEEHYKVVYKCFSGNA